MAADQLCWRPSAYAIVIKDNALLVSPQFDRNFLPGGGLELGEMPEDAVIREVKEETGIIVANPRLLACKSTLFKLPSRKDEFVQSILLYYVCDFVGGELSDEGFEEDEKIHSRFPEWIALADIDTKLAEEKVGSEFDLHELVRKAEADAKAGRNITTTDTDADTLDYLRSL